MDTNAHEWQRFGEIWPCLAMSEEGTIDRAGDISLVEEPEKEVGAADEYECTRTRRIHGYCGHVDDVVPWSLPEFLQVEFTEECTGDDAGIEFIVSGDADGEQEAGRLFRDDDERASFRGESLGAGKPVRLEPENCREPPTAFQSILVPFFFRPDGLERLEARMVLIERRQAE